MSKARSVLVLAIAAATIVGLAEAAHAAAATQIDMADVSQSLNVGDHDNIFVTPRDGSNAVDSTYTGTVTFSASCGDCFTISPNNGGTGATAKQYTYPSGSQQTFDLVWTQPGTHTFTVTGTLAGGGTASDSQSGIVVGQASTTTSTTSASTTSTTSASTTSTTSASTTSSTRASTTSTSAVRAALVNTGQGAGPLALLAVALVFAGLVLGAAKLLGDQNDEWASRL